MDLPFCCILVHCCTFSLQCIKQYIEVQIDDNHAASITCPDPDCRRHGVIDAAEVKFIFHVTILFVNTSFKTGVHNV